MYLRKGYYYARATLASISGFRPVVCTILREAML